MEIKTHPPMKVLYSSHRTTIPKLGSFTGTVARALYEEASEKGALISGPQYWMYHGMDGKDETEFTLEIAIPIQGDIQSSKFAIKEIPAFKSVAHEHAASWEQMPRTYEKILRYIDTHRIPMNDECREMYQNIDLVHPENNRVEIQLGIL